MACCFKRRLGPRKLPKNTALFSLILILLKLFLPATWGERLIDLEQEPIIPIDILNKAQEEASQVAVLSKSLGPFYGEDEAKIMQKSHSAGCCRG